MKRNKFGTSHKVKGSMDFGVMYPVLTQECVPGDIVRVFPETVIKSVIPPVTALTDKITWNIEFCFTPDRILDDHFVRNLSTTKTGTVKGNFKTWNLQQICENYGSVKMGITTPKRYRFNSTSNYGGTSQLIAHSGMACCPPAYRGRNRQSNELVANYNGASEPNATGLNKTFKYMSYYKSYQKYDGTLIPTAKNMAKNGTYNECLPVGVICNTTSGSETDAPVSAPFFGEGSLLDWLGLEPNGNLGIPTTLASREFRTNAISAYYMYINFYHTNPEYEKYIAPYFDYVYAGRDNSEHRETLLRYVTLEDQFGNGFEEPRLSGRCINGLVVDNWHNDYFTHSTKDAQRGIAPQVPVAITGISNVLGYSGSSIATNKTAQPIKTDGLGKAKADDISFDLAVNGTGLSGSFVISDLRSALALQHFQEDTQYTYKWSDFLQKVYGTSPVDLMVDQPIFLGGAKGTLSSTEVLQTVETTTGALGDIGGHLSGYGSGKRITYRAKEHGVFMAIMTIKVERNYESGTERQFTRKNYLDMYFPQFVGIGNQGIRADELFSVWDNLNAAKNIAFTSRYEEMKHKYNRVVGKCRNENIVMPLYDSTGSTPSWSKWTSGKLHAKTNGFSPYLNTFHPYAIGDSYYADGNTSAIVDGGIQYNEINQNFLLCCPQLNDIFVDDNEEPFMVTIGFNMDMFRPLPVYVKPGISYV